LTHLIFQKIFWMNYTLSAYINETQNGSAFKLA
jgi:hypothetical protein